MCLGGGFLLDLSPNNHYFSARRQSEALCMKWSRKFLSWRQVVKKVFLSVKEKD